MSDLVTPAFESPPVQSRRSMMRTLGGGMGSVALLNALAGESRAIASTASHAPPRAKRVIHLFMNGGPFQCDLFDPKPLLEKYAGQRPESADLRTERKTSGLRPSPFAFQPQGESGLPVSELLPYLSKCIDDICVLRSVHTENPNHGPALLLMNNGTILPTRPSMGAWMSYGLGTENESLPSYVVFCPGRPVRFSILWTSAFLPAEHQGTYINHSETAPEKLIPFLRNETRTVDDQRRQLELMSRLNQRHLEQRAGDTQLEGRIRSMETAFRMQFAATEAFDLNQESKSVREEYGEGHFSNGCLLARRLVERGVRFVQVYYGNGQPWDTHSNHDATSRKLCLDADRPMAALLTDLKRRGLLEDTLVIWGGEFGRTPTTETAAGDSGGRDHNHYGFTMWLAGGGVRGGMTYGETDDFGFKAVENPVPLHDLHATILHLLGLNHERLTYRYAGRDFRLTDVAGQVIEKIVA
ncbi:MAG: DUF1501 domain-containing protein [Planctomycetaceae bacterium]|nr:DUF1501 domain-containing protein [Planctomycetaceae bacterium]